ncbi:MAG TPA: SIS domain-containing protein [Oscillospiraceae bacterium]|nr:SIS domain-containing protein [Oscillospiraceae bacterium]HPF55512.1 SIS domain-containing protein [Clostridiales bacterium]HPK35868.1 SIS domain-containing protein [Oscillospiraceae bacterium]HPR76577.1 SIS domain-containing protein [Oscillospiraceae bacterium]
MDIQDLIKRHPQLLYCAEDIDAAARELKTCFVGSGRVYVCGNGGSAADSTHIVGELVKGFLSKRPLDDTMKCRLAAADSELGEKLGEKLQGGLPAHDLCENLSLSTAVANDIDPDMIYAQELIAYGRAGDILIAISTSGNAKNTAYAAVTAHALGMTVIGLTGEGGGKLKEHSDLCIRVPEKETYKVQELHLPIYHFLCAKVEEELF